MKKNILLFTLLLILSCSSDDSYNDNSQTQTFLEKYNGTVWGFIEGGITSYSRFIDNQLTPYEIWGKIEGFTPDDCFQYDLVNLNDLEGFDAITINEENVFETRQIYSPNNESEYVQFLTYSINGNTLQIEQRIFVDGQLNFTELNIQSKQNIDVDALTLCD